MRETIIDLRSDTVTCPSTPMREAMMAADVGDDQYGDDSAMNDLQDRVAELLGKEASLWFPSGTMANQTALNIFTRPGDDVIVAREAHSVWHEAGGSAANAGVQLTEIGDRGLFRPEEFIAAIKPSGHGIFPPTTLVQIENTHNRMGGVIFPQDDVETICAAARERGIATYLDGARLWNAAAATGKSVAELAAPFDMAMVSMSKGLGAPGGSMLAGSRTDISSAQRFRRMFGGAMRQIGFFAAAAHYALDHNISRLREDHVKAKLLASVLAKSGNIDMDPTSIATNIVVFRLKDSAPDASRFVSQARARGILINAFAARTIRAVTHLDVSQDECIKAGDVLATIAGH